MPGPLLETAPFRGDRHPSLDRLSETIRTALDPDGAELELVFAPDRTSYRRVLLGSRGTPLRPSRKGRLSTAPENRLAAPFSVPGLVSGVLVLERRGRRVFTAAERMRFALLTPLLVQIVELAATAEIQAAARRRLALAVEKVESPALLLDASGTILFANEAADSLLSRQTEEGLAVLADDRRETPLLATLLRLAAQDPPPARERLALTNGRGLDVRVALLPDGEAAPSVRLVTLAERAALTLDDVRPLLSARGVSERESDVVGLVLQGLRNAEIAEALFISEYTVKDHLKHVFAKLGVGSRGGLIRSLYAAPPASAATARGLPVT